MDKTFEIQKLPREEYLKNNKKIYDFLLNYNKHSSKNEKIDFWKNYITKIVCENKALNHVEILFDEEQKQLLILVGEYTWVAPDFNLDKPMPLQDIMSEITSLEGGFYKFALVEEKGVYQKFSNENGVYFEKDIRDCYETLLEYNMDEFHDDIDFFKERKHQTNNLYFEVKEHGFDRVKKLIEQLENYINNYNPENMQTALQNFKRIYNIHKIETHKYLESEKTLNEKMQHASYITKTMFDNVISMFEEKQMKLQISNVYDLAILLYNQELYDDHYANFLLENAYAQNLDAIAIAVLNNKHFPTKSEHLQKFAMKYVQDCEEEDLLSPLEYAYNIDPEFFEKILRSEFNLVKKYNKKFSLSTNKNNDTEREM